MSVSLDIQKQNREEYENSNKETVSDLRLGIRWLYSIYDRYILQLNAELGHGTEGLGSVERIKSLEDLEAVFEGISGYRGNLERTKLLSEATRILQEDGGGALDRQALSLLHKQWTESCDTLAKDLEEGFVKGFSSKGKYYVALFMVQRK